MSAEAYPGELEMLRGLVRTLRVVVRPDTVDAGEVRRLLHQHAIDDGQTRTETSAREERLAQLLDTIRTHPGKWSVGRVHDLRRLTGGPVQRSTARRDLAELHRRGHLQQHGPQDGRFYTLTRRSQRRTAREAVTSSSPPPAPTPARSAPPRPAWCCGGPAATRTSASCSTPSA